MTTSAQLTPLAVEDYDAIESAVMETSRGRWFLTEYARRNRNADTTQVLTGLERIERAIRHKRATPDIDRIRLDLADMAEAISRTKQEIAQMKMDTEHGDRFSDASQELDAIVGQTETATNEILLAAEGIQEAAWTLREAGASDELCDKLDVHSTDIYTACSFQDLTGQRTRKVVTVLRYLESRINTMMSIWGLEEDLEEHVATADPTTGAPMDERPDAHLLNGPQLHGRGIEQNAVDDLMSGADEDVSGADEIEADAAFTRIEAEASREEAQAEEPAADVFATVDHDAAAPAEADDDAASGDVFAPDHIEPPLFETEPASPRQSAQPMAPATFAVGNTVRIAEPVAAGALEIAPTLAVVPSEDAIEAIGARARLVTFG